jgi:hypothetical protein
VSLFSSHNWGWNMQCQLETCSTRFTFPLWPPPLLSYNDFCSHPHTKLSFTKKL